MFPAAQPRSAEQSLFILISSCWNNIMRCPKCGYISFDKEEICGGCKKNISKFSKELSGVVLRSNVPDFLWFQKPEEESEPEEDTAEDEQNGGEGIDMSDAAEAETGVDFGTEEETAADESMLEFAADSGEGAAEEEAKEIEFDLSMDADATEDEEEVKEEISFDLPGMEEKKTEAPPPEPTPKEKGDLKLSLEKSKDADEQEQDAAAALDGLDDLDFDLGDASTEPELAPKKTEKSAPAPKPEKSGKQSKKESELDLSGLDLSGLMPPVLEEEQSSIGKASSKAGGSKKGNSKSAVDMLPDLSLDLDAPMSPPSSSSAATGKKMAGPAAKTGTALDDFDIDLGDLLGGGGKKK